MAYTELDDALIVIGEPTKKEIFQTIKDNQESFNTDIEALKQTSTVILYDTKFVGDMSSYTVAGLDKMMPVYRAPVDLTINSVVATLLTSSTSGTFSFQIEVSTDNGVNWTPQLLSAVELTGTSIGSQSGAVNFIDISSQSVSQNDLVRINISTIQDGQGDIHVSITGEVGNG